MIADVVLSLFRPVPRSRDSPPLHMSQVMFRETLLDELGYLPIDKTGADLLFQVISLRYEQGALILTSNRAFKEWPTIFNHDSTLTSAVLDRLPHHADTIIIEGKSFRMKDRHWFRVMSDPQRAIFAGRHNCVESCSSAEAYPCH